jgi:5-amino-6-(5-phosphoribosylamino)uracil reductase
MNKPYVIIKCAMSVDGYIDDTTDERLILSDEADFDRVDEERAKCDAILLGADTVRNDNPRVLIKSEERKKQRIANNKSADLRKVTITSSGNFSKNSKFFTYGESKKIVYCNEKESDRLSNELGELAEVISFKEDNVDPEFILNNLYDKGVKKLMIEGGSKILTMFLSRGLFDEFQVSVAPFFVGDDNAVSLVNAARFINDKNNRMKVKNVEMIGDCALLTYIIK